MKKQRPTKEIKVSPANIWLLLIYLFINSLFFWKYGGEFLPGVWMTAIGHLFFIIAAILITFGRYQSKIPRKIQDIIYFSAVAILSVLFAILMFQFHPGEIAVGRYPALHDWLTKLFAAKFPYDSNTNPSGFPFLFALAAPFYLLGDLGLFQIFSFAAFSVVIYMKHRSGSLSNYRCLFLLALAPVFLYEIVVRSEIFSNMVVVLVFLGLSELYYERKSHVTLIILGLSAGFLLSTRGIVLLIYIIFFGYLFRNRPRDPGTFLVSLLVGFLLTLVPFLIWDYGYFVSYGPFAIQLSYVPTWLLILSVVSSLICGQYIKSPKKIYTAIAITLFGVVFVPFIMSIIEHGLKESLQGDRFDISYFCFSTPFLLISLMMPGEKTNLPNRAFGPASSIAKEQS